MMIDDGRRAYIHRSAFGGSGNLTPGLRLRVIVKPDQRNPGKWMVGEVQSSNATVATTPTDQGQSFQGMDLASVSAISSLLGVGLGDFRLANTDSDQKQHDPGTLSVAKR